MRWRQRLQDKGGVEDFIIDIAVDDRTVGQCDCREVVVVVVAVVVRVLVVIDLYGVVMSVR